MSAGITEIKQNQHANAKANLVKLLTYLEKPESQQALGLNESSKEVAFDVWHVNVLSDESALIEMLAIHNVNPLSRSAYRHFVISWSEGEIPTRIQTRQAASMLLSELQLDVAVAKCGLHYDTGNVHVHLVVITTNPETEKSMKVSFSVESAHRATAKINFMQGWTNDANALYRIDEHGNCNRVRDKNAQRALPAKEVEAFGQQRTAGDIAREMMIEVLNNQSINTWNQLHEYLANAGVAYEKKDAGAIIRVVQDVKNIVLKASHVHRDAVMTAMEGRFGQYQPSTHTVMLRAPEPIGPMTAAVRKIWQQFYDAKLAHNAYINNAQSELKTAQFNSMDRLAIIQRSQREGLKNDSWKGRGSALNDARSIMASKHAAQMKAMKDSHKDERKALQLHLKLNYPHPGIFEDYLKHNAPAIYQTYLEERVAIKQYVSSAPEESWALDPAIDVPNGARVLSGTGMLHAQLSLLEVPNYKCELSRLDKLIRDEASALTSVNYKSMEGSIDFVVENEYIEVMDVSEQSINAFLQLSDQKWKYFELEGSAAFKRKAIDIAVILGIESKIINPELSTYIKEQRKKIARNSQSEVGEIKPQIWNLAVGKTNENDILPVTGRAPKVAKMPHDYALLEYIAQSEDIGMDAKNQSLKDARIAQVMDNLGFESQDIAYAINELSPNIFRGAVHTSYADRIATFASSSQARAEFKYSQLNMDSIGHEKQSPKMRIT